MKRKDKLNNLLKVNKKNSFSNEYVSDRTYKFLNDLIKDLNLANKGNPTVHSAKFNLIHDYVINSMLAPETERALWINLLDSALEGKLLRGHIDGTTLCIEVLNRERPILYNIAYFPKGAYPCSFSLTR